jgi:hypothetical protein
MVLPTNHRPGSSIGNGAGNCCAGQRHLELLIDEGRLPRRSSQGGLSKVATATVWTEDDTWAVAGIALGSIALAASIFALLPAVSAFAGAIAIGGFLAGAIGTAIDATDCFGHQNGLACGGMAFNALAAGGAGAALARYLK